MADNDSTTTDDTTSTDDTSSTTDHAAPDGDQLGDAGKKALEAERSRAREADKRAKAAERELERLKTASLNDQERAVAQAKIEGKQEAAVEAGKRLVRAEIRAAAASAGLKVSADDLDDLDLGKFLDADGEPDPDAIAKRVKRWQALAPESKRPSGSIDQGTRGSAPAQDPGSAFAAALQTALNNKS